MIDNRYTLGKRFSERSIYIIPSKPCLQFETEEYPESENIWSIGVIKKWSTGVLEYWKKQRKPMPEKMPM